MTARTAGRPVIAVVTLALIAASFVWREPRVDAQALHITYHKNALSSPACVQGTWHGAGYGEDAVDIDDICGPNSGYKTVFFRSQGLGQYAVEYTLSVYGGYCTGRRYTLNYYDNGQWTPLIRLNYVHLSNMRSSSQGQLSYYHEFSQSVGSIASSQHADCPWDGAHLHFSRSTNYGLNVHNGASGFGDTGTWIGSNEVTFVACRTSC